MLTFTPPLRVGVLCSRRAPGLIHLLDHDPRRGSAYDVACCITSDDTFVDHTRVERRGVACIAHPFAPFRQARAAALQDMNVRAEYDAETVGILTRHGVDVVLLAGYLLILTAPMLDAFDDRIVNVHHSDLLDRTPTGRVRYPGLRAVRDAIRAGEIETRATAHIVTERLDDGPVLMRSSAYPVPPVAAWAREREEWDVLRAVAWAHQEWMLRDAWGPLLIGGLERVQAFVPRRALELA
jgi:phosphoribosylglycinamide formyltransferase 1